MKRFIDKLTQSEHRDKDGKLPWKPRYFIIIGLVGILFIIISSVFSEDEPEESNMIIDTETEQETEETSNSDYVNNPEMEQMAKSYEQELVKMLNNIQGVSETEVMVNLESSNVKVYESNQISNTQTTSEEDQNGGTRQVEDRTEETQTVLVRQGDTEMPLLVQTKRPEVRGVFVVAKGADQAVVKSWIIEAISSVLDVPTHRISVMPKE